MSEAERLHRNAYQRTWRQSNKKRYNSYCLRWKQAHRQEINRQHREKPNYRLTIYKQNAKSRNLEWSIPDGLAVDLFTDSCFYCGARPLPLNGIDRVNNEVGYVENNVVSSCKTCQYAKRDNTRESFENWVKNAYEHQARFRWSRSLQ